MSARGLLALLSTRQARHGSTALSYAAAVLVILGLVGFLTTRHRLRWDLTRDRRHSLSADTQRVVGGIPRDGSAVEMLGVVSGGPAEIEAARQTLAPLLQLFGAASPRIQTRVFVAEAEPRLARELEVVRFPAVAVRFTPPGEEKPRLRRTDVVTEQAIARTLEELLMGTLPVVQVMGGHGERSPVDGGAGGFLVAAQEMRSDNHDVRAWIPGSAPEVPRESRLVVIPGPESDLSAEEVRALRAYQDRGGRILLFLGPPRLVAGQPTLEAWLAEDWNVVPQPDVVADLEAFGSAARLVTLVLRAGKDATHPVVRDLDKLVTAPLWRSFSRGPDVVDGVEGGPLLLSGKLSWSERDLSQAPTFDEGVDAGGPLAVAWAGTRQPEGQPEPARLVVIGSSELAANLHFFNAGNADLVRNALAWLGGREEVIAARRGTDTDGTAVIPESQALWILISSLALPAIVMAAGVATWWHRRRL